MLSDIQDVLEGIAKSLGQAVEKLIQKIGPMFQCLLHKKQNGPDLGHFNP